MSSLSRFGFTFFGIAIVIAVLTMLLAPATATEFARQLPRQIAGLQEDRIDIPHFRVPFLTGGRGNETILLLHGISADKDHFSHVARHLTRQYQVVAPDLPGFGGASAPREADYGLDAQVERVLQFMDAMELERVHLGGSSMGGYIAATFATRHPDRVASLWLLAPGGLSTAELSPVRAAWRETGVSPLFATSAQDYARVLALVFERPPFLPWFVRDTLASEAAARSPHYSRVFSQIYDSPPLESALDKLQAPTLVVWGQQDRVLDISGAQILADARPDLVQVRLMDGIGHLPMIEDPAGTARDYLAFLEGLGR